MIVNGHAWSFELSEHLYAELAETCQGHERYVLHCQGALCIARKGPQGLLEGETPVAEQPAAEGTNPKQLMGK